MNPGPLCRCCGKPIPKRTTVVNFKKQRSATDGNVLDYDLYSYGDLPQTKDEAQRRTNGTVLTVSRRTYDGRDIGIDRATVWDGESYKAKFFCTNRCAVVFANVFAKLGYQCKSHEEAKKGGTQCKR